MEETTARLGSTSSSRARRNMTEKNRRKQMKDLIAKLASLIPTQTSKLSATKILDQARSYILQLQKSHEESLKKRKALFEGDRDQERYNLTAESSSSSSSRLMLPIMNITSSDSILEVNLICGLRNRNFMLHEIINVLEEEGAEVINATQQNAGDRVIYIIKSKAVIPRIGIEISRVQERLKDLVL
ncbi:putative Transcription factor [Melia azedarach]|uniref:Transcription factor n=1 Tax=Melia azedarach TaxID=155640 RepID=A0ACC1YM01_MELAZ|nr:putative Transcription factor [Melia azedarach]